MHAHITKQIKHSPKNVLIKKSKEIIKLIREVNDKPSSLLSENVLGSQEFESDLIPNYKSAFFKLRNYSALRT